MTEELANYFACLNLKYRTNSEFVWMLPKFPLALTFIGFPERFWLLKQQEIALYVSPKSVAISC